jgi:ATP-dependent Clp protease adapter protein ClpS
MKLFIVNDNKNTFDAVIGSIKRNLNYPYSQCVSIATIVHYSGECLVASSSSEDYGMIETVFNSMVRDGLTVKIED